MQRTAVELRAVGLSNLGVAIFMFQKLLLLATQDLQAFCEVSVTAVKISCPLAHDRQTGSIRQRVVGVLHVLVAVLSVDICFLRGVGETEWRHVRLYA